MALTAYKVPVGQFNYVRHTKTRVVLTASNPNSFFEARSAVNLAGATTLDSDAIRPGPSLRRNLVLQDFDARRLARLSSGTPSATLPGQ